MKHSTDSLSSILLNISHSGRPLRAVVTPIIFLLAASPCFGDGKIIARKAMGKVKIPDQRAFISYQGGIEHLAIETDFQGKGEDFAWIIPTPSPPEVKEVTNGFFPTLQHLVQPKMKHQLPKAHVRFLIIYSVMVFFILLYYTLPMFVPSRTDRVLIYCFIFLCIFFSGFGGIQSAGTVGESSSAPSAVSIHQKERVGSYEVVSLTSPASQVLVDWLNQNGYVISPDAAKVIHEYVQKGWVFTTVKLLQASNGEKALTPHPLSFVFKTDKPVYPLKLTGVDNGRCHIALYVFGPGRAETEGFKVLRCKQRNNRSIIKRDYYFVGAAPYANPFPHDQMDSIDIGHEGLKAAIGDAPILTKLSRTFEPGEMKKDAFITWKPFKEQAEFCYSHQYAVKYTLLCCLAGWLSLTLLSLPIFWHLLLKGADLTSRKSPFFVAVMTAFLITTASGICLYASFPKREAVLLHPYPYTALSLYRYAIDEHVDNESEGSSTALTRSDIKQILTAFIKSHPFENLCTGEPIKEEDSPGNYLIKGTEDEPQLVYFDEMGGEVIAWPSKEEE